MSWNDELYQIYEYNCGRKFDENEPVMLPIAHSTANAQIEIVIDENGGFKGARKVDKSEAVTIIPSKARSGTGANPLPYADKLLYLAGDYGQFFDGKRSDNTSFYTAYINQLKQWYDSEYSHKALKALYAYIEKKCLMSDLIKAGVLETDEQTGKLAPNVKIAGIPQEESFVRVVVNTSDGVNRTWEDKTLYDSFISFNSSLMGENQLCYASGKMAPVTYKHPSKIRNRGDMGKLISANDPRGFTYRGRFADKEEAFAVSYEYSQKVHNALRWLIEKQGEALDSMTVVVWASALQEVPVLKKRFIEDDDPVFDEVEESVPTTAPAYMAMLKKRIFGYRQKLEPNTKVMIMGLDAATTGRLNISFYSELEGSAYLDNIECWHSHTAWNRYNNKKKTSLINSFSLYEIIRCAFGNEQGNFIECDKKFMRDNVLRLIPCITEGKSIPSDIVSGLYHKASNPLAYENDYNHRTVLETACGMIRKQRIDNGKGDISMAYDPKLTDRSYLYGCLLAIADKAESEAYTVEERNSRVTNARRYWNAFSQRPYQTWGVIEERLRPYLDKLGKSQVKYNKWIDDIMSRMSPADYADNRRLDPIYLLGYHHFTDYMYNGIKPENEEE
ncbi:MAG: type I-C CRISPR-associated protein Cas8c/Csd1 [Oscillospiraceae bacterium]|nr:type I-C CRISPR-associated protein Cas8c/Csd1 [Oscillospiraceae bacterium]